MVKNRKSSASNNPRNNRKREGKMKKPSMATKTKRITDARQKIMQKKRTTIVDARDVLANLAKTQDARSKLQKLRRTPDAKRSGSSASIRPIGKHILRKTDRNGKISLITNRNRATTSMNSKIRQQLGIEAQQRFKKQSPRANKGPLKLLRTISNDFAPIEVASSSPIQYFSSGGIYPPRMHADYAPLQITAPRRPQQIVDMSMTRGLVSDARNSEWSTYTRSANSSSFMDVDTDEEFPASPPPRAARLRPDLHSRLDAASTSHGILSQPKTKAVLPPGHRIVVSNLQSTVTQDDIRELFEDIGQLLVARLVRPGTAEVIYKNLNDAQKAVDTYHNRQLDGQPMKCLLVNKRPGNNPTAPALKPESVRKTSAGRNNYEKLVPDVNAIHKVLFQRV